LVNLILSNALYQNVFKTNISKDSSFKNIKFVKNNSISQKGSNRTITLTFDSLGEPSCALVWFTVGLYSSKSVVYGTNALYCSTLYSNALFANVYNRTNNTLNFNIVTSINGLATFNLLIKNDLESLKLSATVTVAKLLLQLISLLIEPQLKNLSIL
jgi:hypothetical protein